MDPEQTTRASYHQLQPGLAEWPGPGCPGRQLCSRFVCVFVCVCVCLCVSKGDLWMCFPHSYSETFRSCAVRWGSRRDVGEGKFFCLHAQDVWHTCGSPAAWTCGRIRIYQKLSFPSTSNTVQIIKTYRLGRQLWTSSSQTLTHFSRIHWCDNEETP